MCAYQVRRCRRSRKSRGLSIITLLHRSIYASVLQADSRSLIHAGKDGSR